MSVNTSKTFDVLTSLTEGYRGSTLDLELILSIPIVSGQRELSQARVQKIKKSILTVGKLIEPLIVYVEPDKPFSKANLKVVAGQHRREALRQLVESANLLPEAIDVPVVLQEYGCQAEELLCTNTSRTFTAYERASVKNVEGKNTSNTKTALSLAGTVVCVFDRYMPITKNSAFKMARYFLASVPNNIDKLESAIERCFEANAFAHEPSNVARYWKRYAQIVVSNIDN